ncbi:MAG TPA: nuclear transport factor 2 family protein [Actinomycetota bacterium]|nr:nuclear transport factor 2 family protein [Actinomycetota bacterium]
MGEHPNLQNLRKGYEAFQQGDMATLAELFAQDVVWHVPGDSPISGDYKGQEEVFGYFGKLVQETEGSFKLDIEAMFADAERGVAVHRLTADRQGKHLDSYSANVYTYDSDGRITEAWQMSTDTQAASEFFS